MKTVFAKPGTVRGDWFVVDASDKTLGPPGLADRPSPQGQAQG